MAQGTMNVAECIPAGSRLLEHHPVSGGGSDGNQACALFSGSQAKISRLWDFEDFDQAPQSGPVNVVGLTPNRGGDQREAAADALIVNARTGPAAVDEIKSSGSLRRADELTETDIGNLSAVLDHEMARNTMKNYRVQWRNFIMWAVGKGIMALPADPTQVAAYLAERTEEHGHKPATLRAGAAAIGFVHRASGHDDPCASPEVKRTLRSATRKAGGGQKQAEGLTVEALTAIRSTACKPRRGRGGRIESRETARCRGNLDIALVSLMRDAMLRVSEAAALTWRDIATQADGTGRLLNTALQDGFGGRGCRGIPVRPDNGGTRVDMRREGRYVQSVRAASQPDIAAHQAGGAGGGTGGRLQRPLAAGGHGEGPGEGGHRVAQPYERGALAQPRNARSLHPQRDRR